MKYLKTIQVDNSIVQLLHNGHLSLQRGQWIKLAWSDRKSRYVGRRPSGVLWVSHWTGKHDAEHFRGMCRSFG